MFDNFDISAIWESNGILISFVGYLVVFLALLFLYAFFANMQKVLQLKQRKKLREVGHRAAEKKDLSISGEISAAIAMALHLHFEEEHDLENTVLTIKKVQRIYSPWSSKLYGLRQFPKK